MFLHEMSFCVPTPKMDTLVFFLHLIVILHLLCIRKILVEYFQSIWHFGTNPTIHVSKKDLQTS